MTDNDNVRKQIRRNLTFEICFRRNCNDCPLMRLETGCLYRQCENGEKFYKGELIEEIIAKAYTDLFPTKVDKLSHELKILLNPVSEITITEDELMNVLEM